MPTLKLQPFHEQRISEVIHYILENLGGDVSLGTLAKRANYSPYHFQKLFKEQVGESPKHYVVRLRLENAAHYLIIHRDKSITEIALDSGFTSGSTFARAFKQHFGISAEALRKLSPEEKATLHFTKRNDAFFKQSDATERRYDEAYWNTHLAVNVKRKPVIRCICTQALLADGASVDDGFSKTIRFAETHDLLTPETAFIGIINPHQGMYKAAVSLSENANRIKGINETVLPAGKYATFTVRGNAHHTLQSLHAFYAVWLPKSGYRIADSNGYEILSENPLMVPYHEIEREIHVAIEPV